jgi:hypothetical protein
MRVPFDVLILSLPALVPVSIDNLEVRIFHIFKIPADACCSAIRRGLEYLQHSALGVVEGHEKETQCLGDITGPPCN